MNKNDKTNRNISFFDCYQLVSILNHRQKKSFCGKSFIKSF